VFAFAAIRRSAAPMRRARGARRDPWTTAAPKSTCWVVISTSAGAASTEGAAEDGGAVGLLTVSGGVRSPVGVTSISFTFFALRPR
jgi:hypothetical protein